MKQLVAKMDVVFNIPYCVEIFVRKNGSLITLVLSCLKCGLKRNLVELVHVTSFEVVPWSFLGDLTADEWEGRWFPVGFFLFPRSAVYDPESLTDVPSYRGFGLVLLEKEASLSGAV